MRDIQNEISSFVQRLRFNRIPEDVISETIEEMTFRIDEEIEDAVVSAYYEAKTIGDSRGLQEFVDDLDIDAIGADIRISTKSGRTDFSTPPFPMMPSLLKNAKIAKDGSRYKVIPMKRKGTSSLSQEQAEMVMGTERAMAVINTARRQMRNNKERRRLDPTNRPSTFEEIKSRARQDSKRAKTISSANRGIDFKTVSSKQDANTAWVNPGKSGDMRGILNQINNDLERTVDTIITSVIADYERLL